MDDVAADIPSHQQIHVILDNYSTHKKNHDWLAMHPNVHFHFTPTSASWLNQVEIWFGIFARKTLAGASFANIEQLIQSIEAFIPTINRLLSSSGASAKLKGRNSEIQLLIYAIKR